MKRLICLLLLLILSVCLFPESNDQVILILPFINTGRENLIIDETLFVSYFYFYFNQLKSFSAIHPHKLFTYMNKYTYNNDDLYDIKKLNKLMEDFHCDFSLGGEYKIENGTLKADIDIYGKLRIKKHFDVKIQSDEKDALSRIAQQTAKAFSGYNPDTASLIVNTDYPCLLYLNDVFLGITSKRFTIPAGEYEMKIVYKDDYFEKVIYRKQITLEKGQIYDLGAIQVLVTYEVKANVESGIYCDGKRIGVTDLLLMLPVGNEFDIEIVYTDNHNDKRYKKEYISTGDGKNGKIEVEFSNRIKMMCGTLPLSGKIGTEIKKLPHTFDNLEPGTYNVQMVLEDLEWKKEWTIYEEKVTLNIAETAVIDKSNFVYCKYWGLCFIPSTAQFYNFEKKKGTILLIFSVVSFLEGMITGYFMIDHYYNTYLPARNNPLDEDINFTQIRNKQRILSITAITGISIFGIIFTYSCIDGIITMNHLYDLFYP